MTDKLNKTDKIYFVLSVLLIIISTSVGVFFLYFSNIRGLVNDIERIKRFNSINKEIEYYFNRYKSGSSSNNNRQLILPNSFKDLDAYGSGYYEEQHMFYDPKDKTNSKEFDYKKLTDTSYQLCAQFEAGSKEIDKYKAYTQNSGGDYFYLDSLVSSFRESQSSGKFEFEPGYQCIEFKVKVRG